MMLMAMNLTNVRLRGEGRNTAAASMRGRKGGSFYIIGGTPREEKPILAQRSRGLVLWRDCENRGMPVPRVFCAQMTAPSV